MAQVVDPRRGTNAPTAGTPARRPGSIRRTSTFDSIRPHGLTKELVQVGRGRDLYTRRRWLRHDARLRGTGTSHRVHGWTDRALDPTRARGAQASTRSSVGARPPASAPPSTPRVDVPAGSLGYLLLDEVPAATLVSGYAVAAAAEHDQVDMTAIRMSAKSQPRLQVPDLCAGFRVGGTMLANIDENDGRTPMLAGPLALSVETPDDEWGWHEFDPLSPHAMRRRRRIDVFGDALVHVDVFFRDSHMDADGIETAVHEYTVEATVDRASMHVVDAARPHHACCRGSSAPKRRPAPVASRACRSRGLRPEVRAQFVGPSTCTHLNDVLRGLEDVEWLVHELERSVGVDH